VRRRFDRSITNFLIHYRPLTDWWILFDNSVPVPEIIASERDGQLLIIDTKLYNELVERYTER
jgi:predicted ABC-type ATPase